MSASNAVQEVHFSLEYNPMRAGRNEPQENKSNKGISVWYCINEASIGMSAVYIEIRRLCQWVVLNGVAKIFVYFTFCAYVIRDLATYC